MNIICKIVIFISLFYCCELHNDILAHEGHDHSHNTEQVTIGRSTYTHFKSILSVYHEVYDNLASGHINHVHVLAQILLDAAGKGIQTESQDSGCHMMQHIHLGAQRLRQAEGLQAAQEAFASISEALSPFLKSWPSQLNNNKIKLYQCRKHGHYWLQPQGALPVCPYAYNEATTCSIIVEHLTHK